MINHRHDRGRIGYSDPYPVHLLKRVDRPTTVIHDDQVQRVDERESGFNRAGRGDFGPHLKKEFFRFVDKHPLSGALIQMGFNLRKCVDGAIAPNMAPLPDNPEWMAGHIKETAYFLRADLVGICKLPPYAVYTHGVCGTVVRRLNSTTSTPSPSSSTRTREQRRVPPEMTGSATP